MRYLLLIVPFVAASYNGVAAQNYILQKYVIGSGGGEASSTNYFINATIGQPVVGFSSSDNYNLSSGFWAVEVGTGAGCDYVVGDVNGSSSYNGLDVTYGVSFFKGGPAPTYDCECTPGDTWYVSGDVNASCSYNGLDITYGVSFFKGGPGPNPCADCPPGAGITFSASNRNTTHNSIVTEIRRLHENQKGQFESVSKSKGNSEQIQNK